MALVTPRTASLGTQPGQFIVPLPRALASREEPVDVVLSRHADFNQWHTVIRDRTPEHSTAHTASRHSDKHIEVVQVTGGLSCRGWAPPEVPESELDYAHGNAPWSGIDTPLRRLHIAWVN